MENSCVKKGKFAAEICGRGYCKITFRKIIEPIIAQRPEISEKMKAKYEKEAHYEMESGAYNPTSRCWKSGWL